MQTANELLKNILFVLTKIDQQSDNSKAKETESKSSKSEGTKQVVNIATALASFSQTTEKERKAFIGFSSEMINVVQGGKAKSLEAFAAGLLKISQALPMLSEALGSLSSGSKWGRSTRAFDVLRKLFDLMEELGSKGQDKVERAINLFDKLGKSLEKLEGPMKTLSTFMMYLGLSFVVFAAGLMLASIILGSSNPLFGLAVLVLTIVVLIAFFAGITRLSKFIDPGIQTIQNMGKAFLYLVLGIMAFFVGMLLISMVIGAGGGIKGMGTSLLIMIAIVGVIILIFMAIGALGKFINPGIDIIKNIGLGFFYLILGIYLFALGLITMAALLGEEPNWKGIMAAGALMIGVILVLVGMFFLLGLADKRGHVTKGVNAVKGMAVGLFLLIVAVFLFALGVVAIAAMLGESPNAGGIAGAMLIMAGIIVGITLLFRILGDKQVAKNVALGALVAMLISVALITIAISMMFLAEAAKQLGALMTTGGGNPDLEIPGLGKVPAGIAGLGMIGLIFIAATIAFAILGIPVVAGLVALGAAVAILMSVALLTFAIGVMALVKASENIPKDLPKKISDMIGGVLLGILGGISVLTEGATGIKGFINFTKNSVKLFAAIGILMAASVALSMFASALGAFARLDSMRPIIGTDSNGKPIFGEAVNITQVSTNIATAISGFINALISSTDTLMEEKADGLERMGEILTGRDGILAAVNQFAQVLQTFAQFGQNNEIGFSYIDENGNQKYDKVSATVVAGNIVSSFMTFVNELTSRGSEFELSRSEGRKMRRLGYTLMGDPEDSDNPGLLSPIFKFAELLKMFTGADATKISFLDEKGQMQSIDPVQAAKLLLGGISAFVSAIGSQEFDESAVQKFGALMDKISGIDKTIPRLTKVSTTLVKLSESIDKLTKSMKLFVKESGASEYIKYIENINKLELKGIEERAEREREEKEKDYDQQKKHLEGLKDLNTEQIQKLAEANKAIQISQESLNDLAKTIVESMLVQQFNFKFTSVADGAGVVELKK